MGKIMKVWVQDFACPGGGFSISDTEIRKLLLTKIFKIVLHSLLRL